MTEVLYFSNRPLKGFGRMGCVNKVKGLGLLVGAAAQNASQATKTVSDVQTGASVGGTVGSVVPGIGTVIGMAVGAALGAVGSLFGPAKEGQAAVTWDDMVAKGYLGNTRGSGFDERYFGEALKGAMDKGKNVWGTRCGADGHQNPDCFYAPLAKTIINGFLTGKVPLTATEPQVWANVVLPWLQSGAGGQINWNVLNGEKTQQLLILAAVDRYLNGLPITRANMPAYVSQASNYAAFSVPPLRQALASILPAAVSAPPPQSAAVPTSIVSTTPAPKPVATIQPVPVAQVQQTPVATQPAQIQQQPAPYYPPAPTAGVDVPYVPAAPMTDAAGYPVPAPAPVYAPQSSGISPLVWVAGGLGLILLLKNRSA